MHPTRVLAAFASEVDCFKVEDSARDAVDRTIRNAVCLNVGAAEHPTVVRAREVHEHLGAMPRLSLLGRDQRMGTIAAPLINAMAVHVEDYDDTHLPTVVHPGAPIVPTALAAAELWARSGAETVSAILAGVEVSLRVANAICPEHYDRGWHLTGTAGHVGAAAAAGRLAALPTGQFIAALALAATQAQGLQSVNGTETKAFHPGKAAADGLEAALLAARGFTAPTEPLVGRRGFATISAPRVDLDRMLDGLGHDWEIEDNAIKPYACGVVSHAAIDAAKELRRRVGADAVAEVDVHIPEVVLQVMGIKDPQTELESKFSVYHCVAVALLDGDGSPRQFSDERTVAGDVVDLRRRVHTTVDPSVAKGSAVVRALTHDGQEHTVEIVHATASAERPMTDLELDTKLRGLVEPRLGPGGGDRLLAACESLSSSEGVGELISASHPAD